MPNNSTYNIQFDNHHDNQHHHGEEHKTVDNEIIHEVGEIIQEERKLSRKFSGIADILEKKMEAGFLTFIIEQYSFRSLYLF